ncbi:hypothetical protein AMR72_08515 [Flavobacterium psychrophilum]|nr:hypothetical protein AMR72_08515 [Flavobacterium psychrophilum]AOE52542.1 hypothetical protein ALW18_08505 [Flavobacterium psychrophilum]
MKKIILATALFLTALTQAQVVEVYNGEQKLENNETYKYSVLNGNGTGSELAKLHLRVFNVSSNAINIKLKMIDIKNNDGGNNVQFCFGELCYNDAPIGQVAPPGSTGIALSPGGASGLQDYFFNNHAGDIPGQAVEYKLGIIQIDGTGAQVGEPLITFTYVYDATAGLSDFALLQKMGISLNSTVIKNTLDINATQNGTVELININGQSVKKTAIVSGSQSVDVSGTASGIYFAKFTNAENKTAQIKIVKN